MADRKLLVTGASGHLGRRVVELLLEAKAGQVVAVTRTPDKLKDFAAKGVEVRAGNFDDPASLEKAFVDVDRLLLISTDELSRPGQRLIQHQNAVAAAQKVGVKHVVYTSMPKPEPGNPITFAPDHYGTEQALKASSLSWTILRHNWYTDFLIPKLSQAISKGKLFGAPGEGGAAYVTREDCARADVAALISTETNNRTLDVTGPGVVTGAQLAQLAAKITGKPVGYMSVAASTIKAGLAGAALPNIIQEMITSFEVAIAEGYLAVPSSTVKDLTGKEPQSVESFLEANKQALFLPPAQH
jgi:NAD(P)H dehydrogenase (quinone)